MKASNNKRYEELGDFLKSRRNKITPEQVGLQPGTRRRTPGLRREEVAQMAGIGLTWYTWLEQGREINVSTQVLDSLCKVFCLTSEERIHLYALANKNITDISTTDDYKIVSETLIHILDRMDMSFTPAYIMDQHWNIVAWNKSAVAVFGDFSLLPVEERNTVYMMFCNENYMKLFDDWAYHAKGIIARFHATMARHIDDHWFAAFVSKIKSRNDNFAEWWSLYDVHGMSDVVKELTHSVAGKLIFEFVSLDTSDNHNLKMLVHTPDESTLEKMRSLLKK